MKEIINLLWKKQTDQEIYETVKKIHKKYPKMFMSEKKFKRLRLLELKKRGKVWSK